MTFEKFINRRAVERQKREKRSERVKSLVLERGLAVFEKYGIHKVVVFGSVASGVYRETSDIDILVMPLKNSQFWNFRFELEEAIDLPIDLYTDLDDPIFVKKIISRGETIYDV
jgi:predicted nucleotidyltransferase